ncbi:ATP-binding protein [Bacillus sp. BRMEA1]|uniref:ATP-binding protein n=1 Tax=Neobacillus endophyticus TaxID=2738405 RepID=UPI00156393CF|nr:ATP-binding protein [Neobacillus endophyticus]NRD79322.1 ATP-binding protein [Neobacillus endophyticus]
MRDIVSIPFSGGESLIIACDNSGAIGMKEGDLVRVPYDIVSYYAFRVAAMECMAAGGDIISVVLNNFCGNDPWNQLVTGIEKGLNELRLKDVQITGTTESNFQLLQSAVGLLVIGKKSINQTEEILFSPQLNFAVIGLPLVGNEVIEQADHVAPLSLFKSISELENIIIWPVGSRGILFELNQMFLNVDFNSDMVSTDIDIMKSAGPSTCFIVAYHDKDEEKLKDIAIGLFHSIKINIG